MSTLNILKHLRTKFISASKEEIFAMLEDEIVIQSHIEEREAEPQERARRMVDREVYYCVSALISELIQTNGYADELLEVMSKPDYKSAIDNHGYWVSQAQDGFYYWGHDDNEIVNKNEYSGQFRTEQESFQNCVEENNIDYDYTEAYEHWIVSDWLADKLEAKGEMILRDFLGLTIWGRCTTGQALYLDGVIGEIVEEVY